MEGSMYRRLTSDSDFNFNSTWNCNFDFDFNFERDFDLDSDCGLGQLKSIAEDLNASARLVHFENKKYNKKKTQKNKNISF